MESRYAGSYLKEQNIREEQGKEPIQEWDA
jgi:hypothetical protein